MECLILLFLILPASYGICVDNESVDLTDGKMVGDGVLATGDLRFGKSDVYTKNISGVMKSFGCVCSVATCLRKCCPLGSAMVGKTCEVGEDTISRDGLQLYYINTPKQIVNVSSHFHVLHGRPCKNVYFEDEGTIYIQADGSLYISLPHRIPPWSVRTPDQYCLDTFISPHDPNVTRLDALICFPEELEEGHHYILSCTCMLISCVFILATVAVYAWVPELKNLHGMVLMAYLLCLLVGFVFMTAMQIMLTVDTINSTTCLVFTFIIYHSLQSGFFWLNVMCFDIWWTFSGKRGLSRRKLSIQGRFYAYAAYAFGIPTVLTIILISLEFSGLPPHPALPLLRHQGCFLYGMSKLLYLYSPIIILSLANTIFFVCTAIRIARISKETSVLKSKESATHDQHGNDKQRLFLYVKLFLVMGINWILEVFSALYPNAKDFWIYTDAYNVLIGLIIFVIFVCKKKTFWLIKRRYRQFKGQPMSRTQTTTSTVSRNDMKLGSMKATVK